MLFFHISYMMIASGIPYREWLSDDFHEEKKERVTIAIQTVTGVISREDLGIAAPHEHVFIDLSAFYMEKQQLDCQNPSTDPVTIERLGLLNYDPYALRDNLILDDAQIQKRELLRFAAAGGHTIVDLTTTGIMRNPQALRRMAYETGLNIVAGAGFYVGSTHSPALRAMEPQAICDCIIGEIKEGMDGTDIKAGVIGEIGISENFTDSERRVLKGAGLAQMMTGCPISVHINPWTTFGIEAARMLLDMGISAQKICICHVDVEGRTEYIERLLQMGVFIEFDNFGKQYFVRRSARRLGYGSFISDSRRVELVSQLVKAGYVGQILLSCDVCLKTLLRAYGGWGFDHVLTNIVPMLLEEGVSNSAADSMLRENPANFLDVINTNSDFCAG